MWFNTYNCPFFPTDWGTYNMFVRDQFSVSPDVAGGTFSSELNFTIKKNCDMIGPIRFQGTVSAITVGTGTDTSPQFVDWLGANIIRLVEVSFGGNSLQKFNNDDIMEYLLYETEEQKVRQHAKLMLGFLSESTRERAAASSQSWDTELLPIWWATSLSNYLPSNALGDDLHIGITIQDLTKVLQLDTGVSNTSDYAASLSNLKLTYMAIHLTPGDRATITNVVHSDHGVLYKFINKEQQQFSVASADTSTDLKLTALRSPCQDLRIIARLTSNLSTNYSCDYQNYIKLNAITVTANNADVHKRATHDELIYHWNQVFHSGIVGLNLYSLTQALSPDNRKHSTNSLNYGGLSDATVTIEKDANGGALTVIAKSMSPQLVQCRLGDMIAIFK